MSTKDENKRGESPKNDQQKLEATQFSENTPPNLKGVDETGDGDGETPGGYSRRRGRVSEIGDDDDGAEDAEGKGEDTLKNGGNAVVDVVPHNNNNNNNNTRETGGEEVTARATRDYETQVIADAIRLLATPPFPHGHHLHEQQREEMSRIGPRSKGPNKMVSRPSLSHVNKIPGELSGQPSVKSTKEDAKYWKSREQELLDKIAALESKAAAAEMTKDRSANEPEQVSSQKHDKPEESGASAADRDDCKSRLQQIEKELFAKQKDHAKEPNLKGMKSPDDVINHLKIQNEDLRGALAKMTAILRDKTALCVNQEKKVAALTNQVESLKEVVAITKDLLNIRNMEVQHISNDISAMESKIDCERQRHNQMLIKMDEAVKLNTELKKEYENQMKLFQHLRDNYEEKIRMITQKNMIDEGKDHVAEQRQQQQPPQLQQQQQQQQRISNANVKSTQVVGKASRGSNFKVNFHDA